ncbi:spore cortex biosynthesis protein YabQ [Clostridium sp. DJ247]|uniref:spore cortex biosynthesis protein YabQ n=1 Tax=Clostridium sp. DJ247 TaxID=2726188 RepID=UPI001628C301|nr:spore cortex biosynthesis protein YabQ [Clostridium sp. DJ247]MBC2580880.1 spore cortex biosynthesis protein YabQ [Clostridium sp. DJ247]
MVISINQQLGLVIFSIIAGIITGVLFDLYRLIRGMNNINNIITFIEDTLFWTFTGVIVFIFLLYMNYAYIGMYVYVWIVIGVYLYIKLFSKIFIRSQCKIFKFLGKIFRVLKNILLYPLEIIFYSMKIKNKKNYKK